MTGGIRPPTQDRSRRTVERLVAAAADLMTERPFEDITVDELVAAAGTSKGAFYYRFESKDDLLLHLNGELYQRALEGWTEFLAPDRWRGASAGEFVEALVARLVRIYEENGELMAAVARASTAMVPEVRSKARELNRHVLTGAAAVLPELADSPGHPDPERGLAVALTVLAAVLPPLLAYPDDPTNLADLTYDEARVELARLLRGYLGV